MLDDVYYYPPPHVKTPWAALQLVCSHHHRHPPGPGAFRFSMAILGTDFFGGTIYIYKYIYIYRYMCVYNYINYIYFSG